VGTDLDEGVAATAALRIFGEMKVAQMQAAAQSLHDGSESLGRTVERLAHDAPPTVDRVSANRDDPPALADERR
jgi:hypothetical protein